MSSHRRRGAAAAISVLTLLAVAGWLQLILDDPGETAPIDGAALVGVVRAGVSVERLAEEPADPEAARRAQADLISAISLVPRLPSDAARAALDTLLIRGLDAVQRFAVANGSSDAEDGREHLAEVAARIDAEVSQMVAARSAGERQNRAIGSTTSIVGLVLSIVAAVAAFLLVAGGRSDASPAVDVPDRESAPRTAAGRFAASPVSSRDPEPPATGSPPSGVLDSTGFDRALEREQSRSKRYAHDLSLITVAVVEGDSIAEHHGVDALDYVIGSIAELARDNTRASDVVGIVNLAEVAVLLSETSVGDAEHVAAKLRRSVEIFPFSDDITPTVSTVCTSAASAST